MYNAEIKSKFIKEYTTSISMRKLCETTFNAFEAKEREWNADLCTRRAEDLMPIMEKLTGIRAASKNPIITVLHGYVRWCIRNNIPNVCDEILHSSFSNNSNLKHQTVRNPLHLQLCLNAAFKPESEKTIDNIFRCFYWLAYGGVAEENILKIKRSDVDFENMVVRYDGEDFPIYTEAIPAFKNCVELNSFRYIHPGYPDKLIYKDRISGDELVRGFSSYSIYTLRAKLSQRIKEGQTKTDDTSIKISYYRVWISGLFYRMYERELAGIPVDFYSTALKFTEGKVYKLSKGRNKPQAYVRRVARAYLNDYRRWKMTLSM